MFTIIVLISNLYFTKTISCMILFVHICMIRLSIQNVTEHFNLNCFIQKDSFKNCKNNKK